MCLAELNNVYKRFGNVTALDCLSLRANAGELLAVLGPNGAGKTTAISILLGLLRPDKGSAQLFGTAPSELTARRRMGVMMQEVYLAPELRVREHIDLIASYYPAPFAADEAMELTHTTPLANRPYGKLSGGQKRQAQFAMAICGRPELLFLDEPTTGLDVQSREAMWQTLRQLVRDGASIVLTTHYLEEAEALADQVAVLAKGRVIAAGSVEQIRSMVSRKRIVCSTALAAAQIQAWPEVERVTPANGQLHIVVTDCEDVVRRLLAADENLSNLEVHRAGLAEAFTELTKEAA
ncbi:MAG: ABC transporter ATP-binding protein [Acidobacteriaceae bacterium]|nr:ABC transporter ATP-binding protein [Acidobacteriaceae bacterium]